MINEKLEFRFEFEDFENTEELMNSIENILNLTKKKKFQDFFKKKTEDGKKVNLKKNDINILITKIIE